MAEFFAGDTFDATLLGESDDAGAVQNAFQWRLVSAGPVTDQDVIDDILNIMNDLADLIAAFTSVVVTWRGIRLRHRSGTPTYGEVDFPTEVVGVLTGDPVPTGVAALTRFPTRRSRVQLRKFYGVLAESSIGGSGNISSSTLTDIALAADFLMGVNTDQEYTWEYGHCPDPSSVATCTQWDTPVAYSVEAVPAYQRRRRRGTGI